jgi:hypothetical protein
MEEKNQNKNIIRSSSVEYLTFIAATGDGGVNAIYQEENIWLTQKMMGVLYNVNVRTINEHLQNIFKDNELQNDLVIRNFRITASDGKSYNTKHYNLSAIISVGYKVNSERAVQFRKWATQILQEFTIKGFAMDDERLKNDGTILGKKYLYCLLKKPIKKNAHPIAPTKLSRNFSPPRQKRPLPRARDFAY